LLAQLEAMKNQLAGGYHEPAESYWQEAGS
jgi:hypothetical protein